MPESSIESQLQKLAIELPPAPPPVGAYVASVRTGDLFLTSGQLPWKDGRLICTGKLGTELTVEQGYEAAKQTALNLMGSLKQQIGDLDRVKRVVKLLCMVNCTPDFGQQPAVANGCSDLLVEVFGDKGKHARSAVGMASLPNNACIEIEMIVEVSG